LIQEKYATVNNGQIEQIDRGDADIRQSAFTAA
jgi:hypothetical protein